jgi:hypothetical protein
VKREGVSAVLFFVFFADRRVLARPVGLFERQRFPISSKMPLSGDRLNERNSFPFAHRANANQSTTLCIA